MTRKICRICGFGGIILANGVCFSCMEQDASANFEPVLFPYSSLFADDKRERDNIIWQVPTRAKVWPLYNVLVDSLKYSNDALADYFYRNIVETLDNLAAVFRYQLMQKPFYCHDNMLHELKLRPSIMMQLDRNATDRLRIMQMLTHDDIQHANRNGRAKVSVMVENLYAYEFYKPMTDERGWIRGFLVRGENLLASDVDFEEIPETDDGPF